MATEWIYRVHIVVRAGTRSVANDRVRAIGLGGNDLDEVFGSVGLSALGHGEPTDLGCSTLMTAAMFDELRSAADLPALASLRYYCVDAGSGTLIETNSPDGAGRIGDAWQWQQSIDDMGLSRIEADAHPRVNS